MLDPFIYSTCSYLSFSVPGTVMGAGNRAVNAAHGAHTHMWEKQRNKGSRYHFRWGFKPMQHRHCMMGQRLRGRRLFLTGLREGLSEEGIFGQGPAKRRDEKWLAMIQCEKKHSK